MIEKQFQIKNKLGLHARPAALFVQTANRYRSKIRVIKEEQEVDGKSIMGILMLAAEYHSTVRIIADGEDEAAAIGELGDLFESGFKEL